LGQGWTIGLLIWVEGQTFSTSRLAEGSPFQWW